MLAVVLLAALTGCNETTPKQTPLTSFNEALANGASCQELFDIRNSWDPKSPGIETANVKLREVGCYHSGATRTG